MKLQHLSMFKYADNDNGFIQCTIKPMYQNDFEALGFVDSVDRLEKPVKKKSKKVKHEDNQGESSQGRLSVDSDQWAND